MAAAGSPEIETGVPLGLLHRSARPSIAGTATILLLAVSGCTTVGSQPEPAAESDAAACVEPVGTIGIEQLELFRRAETERAARLTREIERLQADLKTAEAALVQAESDLAGGHSRADAVSALAGARIQVERAAIRAPWRSVEIDAARMRLANAENQVSDERFGAALFFVYRARRVAEWILEEAELVMQHADARLVRGARVNLRAGPSRTDRVLSVLLRGTPVFPQSHEGDWMLVQVTSGPSGWIHRGLVGPPLLSEDGIPAAVRP